MSFLAAYGRLWRDALTSPHIVDRSIARLQILVTHTAFLVAVVLLYAIARHLAR